MLLLPHCSFLCTFLALSQKSKYLLMSSAVPKAPSTLTCPASFSNYNLWPSSTMRFAWIRLILNMLSLVFLTVQPIVPDTKTCWGLPLLVEPRMTKNMSNAWSGQLQTPAARRDSERRLDLSNGSSSLLLALNNCRD
jgi:hypothetical protein